MADNFITLRYSYVQTMVQRISELEAENERLRASADQLANALRAVQHDRPSAHTDDVWAAINHALTTHEEARRG